MEIVGYLNKHFTAYRDTLTKPKPTAHKLTREAALPTAAKELAVFTFLGGFISVILLIIGNILKSLVALGFGGNITGIIDAAILSIITFFGYFLAFVPFYITLLISLIIAALVSWVIAKVLGGKADFGKQFGSLITPFNAIFLLSAIIGFTLNILVSIVAPLSADIAGILGLLFYIPSILLGAYLMVLWVIFTAEANDFELWKGAVAIIVPLVLGSLVFAVIGAIIWALFAAAPFLSSILLF